MSKPIVVVNFEWFIGSWETKIFNYLWNHYWISNRCSQRFWLDFLMVNKHVCFLLNLINSIMITFGNDWPDNGALNWSQSFRIRRSSLILHKYLITISFPLRRTLRDNNFFMHQSRFWSEHIILINECLCIVIDFLWISLRHISSILHDWWWNRALRLHCVLVIRIEYLKVYCSVWWIYHHLLY